MRRTSLVLLVLASAIWALPISAHAEGTIDFQNQGGMLYGTNAGMSMTGSELTTVEGLSGLGSATGNLGTVSFSTGQLLSGSLSNCKTPGVCATFAGGGSFVVTGNGSDGVPDAVIFNGTFKGPVQWVLLAILPNGFKQYELKGEISGMVDGTAVYGATVEMTIQTCSFFNGKLKLSAGSNTSLSSAVPEPSTLGLLGTGLLGLAGVLRHRSKG